MFDEHISNSGNSQILKYTIECVLYINGKVEIYNEFTVLSENCRQALSLFM